MIEISDQALTDKNAESWGENLAGEIEKEFKIDLDNLKQTGMMGFFLGAIRQFVIECKCQQRPDLINGIQKEEWLTQIQTMWITSQQPGEYNPLHIHTNCHVSAVMYIKVPKMLPSMKFSPEFFGSPAIRNVNNKSDGSILFVSNFSGDFNFSAPHIVCPPKVGDLYIFRSNQQHLVYPFRCV